MGCPFPPFLILWLTELCWRSQCIWAPSLPASWLSNLLFTSGASGWCRCRPGSALYSPAMRGGESGGLLCLLSQLESWRSPLPPSLMSHIPRSSPPILPKQHITYSIIKPYDTWGAGGLPRDWWMGLLKWSNSPLPCCLPLNLICTLDSESFEGEVWVRSHLFTSPAWG